MLALLQKGFWIVSPTFWGRLRLLVALGACFASAASLRAQDPSADELRRRVERLEKKNDELLQSLRTLQNAPSQRPASGATLLEPTSTTDDSPAGMTRVEGQRFLGDYRPSRDDATSQVQLIEKKPAEPDAFVVGNGGAFSAGWDKGLRFVTQDQAFKVHVGGRTQVDGVWWQAPEDVQFAPNGTGRIRDGVNFRRARLEVDGTLYEVFDFFAEYEFLGNTFNVDPGTPNTPTNIVNTPGPTDLWATITHLPWIGNLRMGNMKPPLSFEHLTSSRWLNFMERSFAFDAYIGGTNNGFQPGIMAFNWTENERATWALGVFKNNQTVLGWNVGDGEYEAAGRLTALPIYEEDGRCLVHLGIGASHRDLDEHRARLRARTLLRNGPFTLQTVLADVTVGGTGQNLVIPEFAMVWGPWSVQAEYFGSWITDATLPVNKLPPLGTYFTQSAYVEVLYFLTGEYRPYNKKGWSGPAFDRVIPNRNFFFMPGEKNRLFSSGAWQVGARYSWIDLNDGAIAAGRLNDITLGLNWFLNPNMSIRWNYSCTFRDAPGTTADGTIHGFGTRMQYDF